MAELAGDSGERSVPIRFNQLIFAFNGTQIVPSAINFNRKNSYIRER
jgi:hypothetical protein